MSDDERLSRLWAADEPASADPQFTIDVVARIARRRLRADVAALVPLIVGIAAVAWATAPLIEGFVRTTLADTNLLIAVSTSLALIVWVLGDVLFAERNS